MQATLQCGQSVVIALYIYVCFRAWFNVPFSWTICFLQIYPLERQNQIRDFFATGGVLTWSTFPGVMVSPSFWAWIWKNACSLVPAFASLVLRGLYSKQFENINSISSINSARMKKPNEIRMKVNYKYNLCISGNVIKKTEVHIFL